MPAKRWARVRSPPPPRHSLSLHTLAPRAVYPRDALCGAVPAAGIRCCPNAPSTPCAGKGDPAGWRMREAVGHEAAAGTSVWSHRGHCGGCRAAAPAQGPVTGIASKRGSAARDLVSTQEITNQMVLSCSRFFWGTV